MTETQEPQEPPAEPQEPPAEPQEPLTETQEPEPLTKIQEINKYFDATFVINFTGKGIKCAETLTALGINNCIVVSPDLPDKYAQKNKIVYYLDSLIETAKEESYQTINIIADHLLIHTCFIDVLYLSLPKFKETDWEFIHYCCNNHKYENITPNIKDYDHQTYLTLNPDLPESIKQNKPKALQDWFTNCKHNSRYCKTELLPSISNNILACAIKSCIFDNTLDNLKTMLKSSKEIPLFSTSKKYMMCPNLFIVPNTGASIMKQLRWLPQLYKDT